MHWDFGSRVMEAFTGEPVTYQLCPGNKKNKKAQQFYEIYNIYHLNSSLKIDKSKLQCTENYNGEEVNHLSKNCKTLLLRNTKYIVEEIRQLSKNRKSQVHCQLVLSESPAVRLTIGLCHKLNWCTFHCVPTYHQGGQGRNTYDST